MSISFTYSKFIYQLFQDFSNNNRISRPSIYITIIGGAYHMQEVWKDIYFVENGIEWDYRGLYQVSNLGNVKSLKFGKEKILKGGYVKEYHVLYLYKDGKRKQFKVHRLVAHMFLSDTYFENAQVNHIDENHSNNCVLNLEWCDCKYNINYGTRNERTSEKEKGKQLSEETKQKMSNSAKERLKNKENHPMYGKNHPNSIKVAQYDKNMNLIKIWNSILEAGKILNIPTGNISNCINGKRKSCGGFIWKVIE